MIEHVDHERREILLVEYQKAQDSAEHHDNLVGGVTSLWLGSAILVGFVLTGLNSNHVDGGLKVALFLVIVLGIGLALAVLTWAERASKLKVQKYERCKAIEQLLGMRQHSDVGPARSWQATLYRSLIVLLLATWVVLLIDVATR